MSQELRNNYFFDLMVSEDRRTRALSDLLVDLYVMTKAVETTGRAGVVTLEIKCSKDKNDEIATQYDFDIRSKVPKPKRKSSIVFTDEKNRTVCKTDPRQLEMLAEKEDERQAKLERDRQITEQGLARIGRGAETVSS
jgi:hypothetical protein